MFIYIRIFNHFLCGSCHDCTLAQHVAVWLIIRIKRCAPIHHKISKMPRLWLTAQPLTSSADRLTLVCSELFLKTWSVFYISCSHQGNQQLMLFGHGVVT